MLYHNQITLNQVIAFTKAKQNCCVVNACGSGKTTIMSEFIKMNPTSTFMILTKQKNAKSYYCNKNKIFDQDNVIIKTYTKMQNEYKLGKLDNFNVDFMLLDEAHYLGAVKWKIAFKDIVAQFHPICIGLTATPQRFEDQGTDHTIVKEFFNDNIAGNYSAKDLQQMGVFIEPEYVLSIYNLHGIINEKMDKIMDAALTNDQKNGLLKKLNSVLNLWENKSKPELIFQQYVPKFMYKTKCNRILVYVSNIMELPNKRKNIDAIIKTIFNGKSVKSYDYTYKTNEKQLAEFMREDNTYIKILYSIDKIMETIHIDDLNIVIMLRPSVSNRIITQQFGRINSINNKNQSLIIDMVDNLTNLNEANKYISTTINQQIGVENKTTVDIQIPHITGYYRIFDLIDTSIKMSKYYEYNGVTASLRDICYIFLRDYDTVNTYIEEGYTIEDAIENAPINGFKHSEQVIFNAIEDYQFTLTPQERAYAEANFDIVEHLIQKHSLDEDSAQNLYIHFCYILSKYFTIDKELYLLRQRLSSSCRSYCIRLLKNNYIRSLTRCSLNEMIETKQPIHTINVFPKNTNLLNTVEIQHDNNKLLDIVKKVLLPKEFEVISLYFGFCDDGETHTLEEIGHIYHITRERVRQIIENSLRKLRSKKNFKDNIKVILEAYNNEESNNCWVEDIL